MISQLLIRLFGCAKKRSRGFTFFELIVVMCILALMTGAVTVSVSSLNEDTRLSNAAYQSLALIRFAQELAMTERRDVRFDVDVSGNSYAASWVDTGQILPDPTGNGSLSINLTDLYRGDANITSSNTNFTLRFTGTGEPLINGLPFAVGTSVIFWNSTWHLSIYPTGFSTLEEVEGGGGCGFC